MSANAYKTELRESILSLLWRQWVGVGIAGHGQGLAVGTVVDPEALIIITSVFARYDQRLYDLMLDWLSVYGALINTTRLKALVNRCKYKDKVSVGYIAAHCERNGDKRWSRLASEYGCQQATPEYLFISADGDCTDYVKASDSLALQYGFIRNAYERQNKLLRCIPESDSSLLLRLRGLFGVNARADVFLLLLQGAMSLQQLADGCGYTRGAVIEILKEWELSHVISRIPYSAKRDMYRLNHTEFIKNYYGVDTVLYPAWSSVFEAIVALWQLVSQPALQKVSDTTFRGELSLLYQEQMVPSLSRCGIKTFADLSEQSLLELPLLLDAL